jgi:acetyl-CoA synthetase
MQGLGYPSLAAARESFEWDESWSLAEGTPDDVNATVECLDRHEGTAINVRRGDGRTATHTYGELSRGAARFAHFLEAQGVDAGDRVAVMLDPSYAFLVALFGAMKRGAVAVPCSELFGPEALSYRLADSDAEVLVTTPEVESGVDAGDVTVLHPTDLRDRIAEYPDSYEATTTGRDDAWLQYTSGTTGTPTAVPYQHESVVYFGPVMDLVLDYDADEVCFTTSSTGWGTGIWIGLFSPLFFGVTAGHFAGAFDPDEVLDAVDELDVTALVGVVPTAYRKLVRAARDRESVPTVAKANYVGEPIDASLSREVESTFGAFPRATYGVTEVRSIITVDYAYPDYEFRHGSMGQALVGVEVRVVDDDGDPLPDGEVGRVAVRRSEEWIVTEDAASRDPEGYFWSVGRLDDTIISAGYTIGPQEVERALREHPAVHDAGVVGVPDEERGQAVKAFVVADAAAPDAGLGAELRTFVREELSKHEYPREVAFVDSLPRTPDGKVRRSALREE